MAVSDSWQIHGLHHLQCGWQVTSENIALITNVIPIFNLKRDNIFCTVAPTFKSDLSISENSIAHASNTAASFGVEGSYGAFAGSASASLEAGGGSETETMRCTHDLYAIKYKAQNQALNYAPLLRPEVVEFVKSASPSKIVAALGQFFAKSLSFGGQVQLSRMVEKRSEDSSMSMHASVKASYGVALASVSVTGSTSHSQSTTFQGRQETATLSIRGGDIKHWMDYNGKNQQECQTEWANSIRDDEMYPMEMSLVPIWEAFQQRSGLESKAREIKKYLESTWSDALQKHTEKIREEGNMAPGSNGTILLNADYRIICCQYDKKGDKRYIDAHGGKDLLYRSHYENDHTTWRLENAGGGYVRFFNRKMGGYMDAHGSSSRVYRSPYKNDHTSWQLVSTNDGYFRLQSKKFRGSAARFLDGNGNQMNGVYRSQYYNNYTKWRFVPVGKSRI